VKKALIVIAGIAGLLAATPLTGGEKIVGGPFTVSVTQRTATMVWIVQTDEMTLRPATGTASRTSPSLRVEKTTFTGLQPNTRYEYAIPDAGDVGTGSFKTPPPAGPVPYRFVVNLCFVQSFRSYYCGSHQKERLIPTKGTKSCSQP
jgi:hypothetical protein